MKQKTFGLGIKMELKAFFGIFCVLTFINTVNSDGKLFIGFLEYSNPKNTDYTGKCCDGMSTPGQCDDPCDLIFSVSVQDSKSSPQRLSDKPMNLNGNSAKFPHSSDVRNPLSLPFKIWPGNTVIQVEVLDQDGQKTELVDNFTFTYKRAVPSLNYTLLEETGNRNIFPSKIKMVFRYECTEPTVMGNFCLTNTCMLERNQSKCNIIQQTNNQLTSTSWIAIPSTTNLPIECGRTEIPNQRKLLNCTSHDTTTDAATQPMTEEHIDTTEPITSTEHNSERLTPEQTTDPILRTSPHTEENSAPTTTIVTTLGGTTDIGNAHLTTTDSSTNVQIQTSTSIAPENTEKSLTSRIKTTSSALISTTEFYISTVSKSPSTKDTDKRPIDQHKPRSFEASTLSILSSTGITEVMSTIKDINDGDDGPMKYWPGIVGGILGACVVAAVVSYIVYSRRRKLRKRNNDIYNVNPKRWVLDPPQENGTSGKSEIALETEAV